MPPGASRPWAALLREPGPLWCQRGCRYRTRIARWSRAPLRKRLWLAQMLGPRQDSNLPGRKSDVSDAAWLAQLCSLIRSDAHATPTPHSSRRNAGTNSTGSATESPSPQPPRPSAATGPTVMVAAPPFGDLKTSLLSGGRSKRSSLAGEVTSGPASWPRGIAAVAVGAGRVCEGTSGGLEAFEHEPHRHRAFPDCGRFPLD